MSDKIVRAVTNTGAVRAFAAATTSLVNEAHRMHRTWPVASAALGRTLTAAAMMGWMLKSEKESVTLQLNGDGPIGRVIAIADSQAHVKGYVGDPMVDLPKNSAGKLNVGGAVGKNGYLTVIRDLGMKEPYIGRVPLVSGEIGDDLTSYFAISEQTPSSVGLGVLVDTDLSIKAAGGFLVQVMPEATEEDICKLERNIGAIQSVTAMMEQGLSSEDMIGRLLDGFSFEITDTIEPRYFCDCSRQRVERALISLGEAELTKLIEEDGKAELTCHFCDKVYTFDRSELEALLLSAKK